MAVKLYKNDTCGVVYRNKREPAGKKSEKNGEIVTKHIIPLRGEVCMHF